ncbi:uncharacterized protein TEOVI_000031900 [Trypanosoma equiperdum]|uniref:Uncharacterized protein n=2 Tax=Trypanozoon TaxID=39700 RepID=Q387Q7_TRYB2|nr:hypothetical protein, conserved [Trypanosoma brucei brucei TREU927]EAN78965.1 hypothetical protein, conserved [Trypanosoma brucei brucei TREU927]SCU66496.1 hypothetical protein, conserved [Trypanosoma equiperdum]
MFSRRVASCCPIPTAMYGALHINTKRQASRLVSPLVPVAPSLKHVAGASVTVTGVVLGELSTVSLASNVSLLSLVGPLSQLFMNGFASNPVFMRVISDTMHTYSVLLHSVRGGAAPSPPGRTSEM